MLISLVIPVYNEELNVPHLWRRLNEVIETLVGYDFEVVFVDDGSADETASLIEALPARPRVAVQLVKFSRNFGHQAAVSAGMTHATGDALIFLDADLQDPPELIPQFLEKFKEGCDVVYGVRQNRKEGLLLRTCFVLYYRIFNRIAMRPIPLDAGDFGLMSKRVAKLIATMPEHDRLVRGLRSWVGFKQAGVPYDRPERLNGETRYRIWPRIEGALDGLFSFSKFPIRFSLVLGMGVIAFGVLYIAYTVITSMFHNTAVPGWKSLVTLGFLAAGANIVATAIVGEYVSRIYFQTKNRPLFVVDKVVHKGASPEKAD